MKTNTPESETKAPITDHRSPITTPHEPITRRGSIEALKKQETLINHKDVVIYIRASTSKQKNTLGAQQDSMERHAQENDLTIHKKFIDEGTSASCNKFKSRSTVKKMLRYMEQNGIHKILCYHPDRAFRKIADAYTTMEELNKENLHLVFAHPKGIDTSSPIGKMMLNMLFHNSEFEIEEKKRRQVQATQQLRKKTIARCQITPYGWTPSPHPTAKTKAGKTATLLTPHPQEQATLARIHTLFHHQDLGFTAIANILNREGIKTKQAGQIKIRQGKEYTVSGTWHRQTVRSVIEHAEIHPDYQHLIGVIEDLETLNTQPEETAFALK